MTQTSALTPARGDVVLSRADDGSERYVLSKSGGRPQIVCATYELAAAAAGRFAQAQHLDVWLAEDRRTFRLILECHPRSRA